MYVYRRSLLIPGSGRSPGEGIGYPLQYSWASLVAQVVKNPPGMQETSVQSLDWKDRRRAWQPSLVFLPGESPWTEESGGLWSMGSQRVRHNWAIEHSTCMYIYASIHMCYSLFLSICIIVWGVVFCVWHRSSPLESKLGWISHHGLCEMRVRDADS